MNLLILKLGQQQTLQRCLTISALRSTSNFTMTQTKSETVNKEFWEKNKTMQRPTSPHLTIYKFQLPANMSIMHRATGLAASVALYTAGITALCTDMSFPEILPLLQQYVPVSIIILVKTGLGGSLLYHTLNGVRHLVWDMGYGFQLKHLYISGFIVTALTTVGTFYIFIKS